MKPFLPHPFCRCGIALLILLFPLFSYSQTFFGESGTPADNAASTTATITITPVPGMLAGDLVIIYAHSRGANTPNVNTTGGQTWTTIATGVNSATTQRTAVFWCEFNGTWATNPIVGGGTAGSALTAVMYVYRPSDPANFWTIHLGATSANVTNTTVSIASVTTTATNTVTMAFWGSPDDNTWGTLTGAGWSKTGVAQYRNTGGTTQSHTAAYNIQANPATLPAVSQVQSSSDATRTSIIAWYEMPPPVTPSNDECSGAITLPVYGGTCSSTVPANIAGATASTPTNLGGPGNACGGGTAGYDVWFKFVAVNTGTTTITLSGIGANFTNRRMEAFSGNCGTLTYVSCSNLNINTLNVATTAGTVYYVRVASTSTTSPITNAAFSICATTAGAVPLRFGNSYVNITKQTTGGTVSPGDILEIRMTINHTTGTVYYPRYVDNIPVNTAMLTSEPIRIITNEGLTYNSYTVNDAVNDDAATYKSVPGANEYNVRMNLGFGANVAGAPADNTSTSTGGAIGQMIAGTHRPRGGGGMLFATAFRVTVTGGLGDTITINPGQFLYKATNSAVAADVVLTATPFKIVISEPLDLCANSIGVNIAGEDNGTFGSGTALNRGTNLATPIATYTFVSEVNANNAINDGRYAIVKNISPRSGTNRNARKKDDCDFPAALPANDPLNCNNRMFGGHWDIDGDHTATNDAIGNLPPAASEDAGYMLLVNADYVASEVYQQTITSLCPNTYYEFSAWVRNVCSNCGMDSLGLQFQGTVTAPDAGYPGVNPNLTFALNGVDVYSSGEVQYSSGWVKKGFVFKTAIAPQNYTLTIRNNSQGGGGNDWAMDDIAIATCFPTMSYSPSVDPQVCANSYLTISDTVRSYYDNYTEYKWQYMPVSAITWSDIPGTQGSAAGNIQLIDGYHTFISSYTIPTSHTLAENNGDQYRLVVASNPDNLLYPECSFSDPAIINVTVDGCIVLATDLLHFNGKLVDTKAQLSWSTSQENAPVTFIIEKSTDGRIFSTAGELPGYNNDKNINHYSFTDPLPANGKIWYRIVMITANGKKKHSAIIQLKNELKDFDLSNIINPFRNSLSFNVTVGASAAVLIELIDMSGKTVLSNKQVVYKGTNSVNLNNTEALQSGMYTLRVSNKDRFIVKRVMKKN